MKSSTNLISVFLAIVITTTAFADKPHIENPVDDISFSGTISPASENSIDDNFQYAEEAEYAELNPQLKKPKANTTVPRGIASRGRNLKPIRQVKTEIASLDSGTTVTVTPTGNGKFRMTAKGGSTEVMPDPNTAALFARAKYMDSSKGMFWEKMGTKNAGEAGVVGFTVNQNLTSFLGVPAEKKDYYAFTTKRAQQEAKSGDTMIGTVLLMPLKGRPNTYSVIGGGGGMGEEPPI